MKAIQMRTRDIILAVVVVVLAVFLLATPSLGGMFGYGRVAFGRGFEGPGMMFGYGFWWWPLLMLVFWAIVIAGGVTLLGRFFASAPTGSSRQIPPVDSALDILRERYARGEITKEQFDQMLNDLNSTRRTGPA